MRILVADDDAAGARALACLLELLGHHVVGPAADGAQAVDLAGSERPDLAILDVDMPGVSGLEAAATLTRRRAIPLILLAGHSDPAHLERAAALPVFCWLPKPAHPDALVPAIRLARARFEEWALLQGALGEMRRRLEERKTVERAKGILMETRGISEADAHRLLQRQS